MLNFDEANNGLNLIANSELGPMDADELSPRTRLLIERLLDQIDKQARQPTESENTYLRSAIHRFHAEAHEAAIDYAFRASKVGATPITPGLDEPDRTIRTIPLRSLLSQTWADQEGKAYGKSHGTPR